MVDFGDAAAPLCYRLRSVVEMANFRNLRFKLFTPELTLTAGASPSVLNSTPVSTNIYTLTKGVSDPGQPRETLSWIHPLWNIGFEAVVCQDMVMG